MFSLIITLIAIALVAALALATLYYGGPVFNEGSERTLAAKLDAQGQQIMGALELYNAEQGQYPATLADLVTSNYLKSIPTAAAEQAVLAAAYAASGAWSLSSPGKPVIVMKPVSLATCQAFNKSNLGVSGVLQQAHSTVLKQCIGTDVNNLMIIQPKSATDLIFVSTDPSAVVQIGTVLTSPIPSLTDTTANGWAVLSTTVVPTPPLVKYLDSNGEVLGSATFASTPVGSASDILAVTVHNNSASALTITNATAASPFSVVDSSCTYSALEPGANCDVLMVFSPEAAQNYSGASYSLSLAAQGVALPSLLLTGTVPPRDSLEYLVEGAPASSLNFGYQADGASPLSKVVQVRNNGTTTRAFSAQGATVTPPFAVTSNSCASANLAPGASCSVAVSFLPAPGQTYQGPSYKLAFEPLSGTADSLELFGTSIEGAELDGIPRTKFTYNLTLSPVDLAQGLGINAVFSNISGGEWFELTYPEVEGFSGDSLFFGFFRYSGYPNLFNRTPNNESVSFIVPPDAGWEGYITRDNLNIVYADGAQMTLGASATGMWGNVLGLPPSQGNTAPTYCVTQYRQTTEELAQRDLGPIPVVNKRIPAGLVARLGACAP